MSRRMCSWSTVFGLAAVAGFGLWAFAPAASPGMAISAAEASELRGGQSSQCYNYKLYYCLNAPMYYCGSIDADGGNGMQPIPCVATPGLYKRDPNGDYINQQPDGCCRICCGASPMSCKAYPNKIKY